MIPQRIDLQGFLSYKEKQEVRFDDAPLWMLAGVNGSGKSSVFDAVTYALFGWHRGGQREADQLINKDCDSLAVEFDFLLGDQEYRARRTLKRSTRGTASATQQISWRPTAGNGNGGWQPVEGTKQKREFDAWVQEHLGLNYETFTSSVLLLQGKAEKLLDSTAKGRFEVLASIVDLDRYQRLHGRADGQRKELEEKAKGLKNHLTSLPEVDNAQLAEADERIAAAEKERTAAQEEVERLLGLESQARQWVEVRKRLADVERHWQEAQRLLADAPAIERDVNRLRELREVLPHLEVVAKQRREVANSEGRTADLSARREKLTARGAELDHALGQARDKRHVLQQRLLGDERQNAEVATQLLRLTELKGRLETWEQHEADLARVQADLARLPADPAALLDEARTSADELAVLAQVVPLLARLHGQREELIQAHSREQAARQALEATTRRGEQLGAEVKRLRPLAEEAARARRQAETDAAETRALAQQARQQLDEFLALDGAKTCRHCGQPLTAQHVEAERRRRRAEAEALSARSDQASAAQQTAVRAEQQHAEQLTRTDRDHQEAREAYREQRTQAEHARQKVDRLQRECGLTWSELPLPFRGQVSEALPADWTVTAYPAAADLDAARRRASGLSAARRLLAKAEETFQQWNQLKGQETTLRQGLARLQAELPADRAGLRGQFLRLEAEARTLAAGLATLRQEEKNTQQEIDRLTQERQKTLEKLGGLDGELKAEESTQQHSHRELARALKELSPPWQARAERVGLAELHVLAGERDALTGARTDERGAQLQEARVGISLLEREKAGLLAQAEAIPPEARQEPATLEKVLATARQVLRSRDEELRRAHSLKDALERDRRQREELVRECLRLEGELATARTLAELLGRDRLQLHLVRQAERQVVDHANAVLDRLSGGQLCLRLCGEAGGEENATKALELEAYNRVTGEKPINVAFLSGSQRFRVAVSLALGIGQYASRQHRPIESVIIDEGFGCLDRQGRQVMIQELQNLRGQMRCILLVSHQEEFADAFADGYRFELADGATKVTRFQR